MKYINTDLPTPALFVHHFSENNAQWDLMIHINLSVVPEFLGTTSMVAFDSTLYVVGNAQNIEAHCITFVPWILRIRFV